MVIHIPIFKGKVLSLYKRDLFIILCTLVVVTTGIGTAYAIFKHSTNNSSYGETSQTTSVSTPNETTCGGGTCDNPNAPNITISSPPNVAASGTSSKTSSQSSTTTAPALPRASVDPVIAWYNNYIGDTGGGTIADKLINDANAMGTAPCWGNVCGPNGAYSGLPSQSSCQQMQSDVGSASTVPADPDATMNGYWQNAVINFQSAEQACLGAYSNPGSEPGGSISTPLHDALNYLSSLASAMTNYYQKYQ